MFILPQLDSQLLSSFLIKLHCYLHWKLKWTNQTKTWLYWVHCLFLLTVTFYVGFCFGKLILSILLLVICHGQPLLLHAVLFYHCSKGHFFCRPCKISLWFICFVHSEHPGFLSADAFFSPPGLSFGFVGKHKGNRVGKMTRHRGLTMPVLVWRDTCCPMGLRYNSSCNVSTQHFGERAINH